jgi:hypothetical protein
MTMNPQDIDESGFPRSVETVRKFYKQFVAEGAKVCITGRRQHEDIRESN